MICQIYIIHNLNLDRKTFHLTFKIDPNKMVKWIKGVANLFMLYRLSNVLKLLLMIEQIRALRPVKKVNLATEDGWLGLFLIYYKKQYLWQVSQNNKCDDSNKTCSWENLLNKNENNSMLIRDFRVDKQQFVKKNNFEIVSVSKSPSMHLIF